MNSLDPTRLRQKSGTFSILLASIALFSLGNLAGWLSPQILFGSIERFHVSAWQGGLPTLIEGVVAGLLSMALGAFAPRLKYITLAALSCMIYLAVNIGASSIANFPLFVFSRFLAGVADACMIYVSIALIANLASDFDRNFAILSVACSVYGAAILAIVPLILPSYQGLGYLTFAGAVAVLLVAAIFWIPRTAYPSRHAPVENTIAVTPINAADRQIFLCLLLILIPECLQSFTVFAFSPAVGQRIGMSEASINTALSVATLISIAGPFLAAWLARRFGRWIPSLAMAVLIFSANVLFFTLENEAVFRIALLVNLTASYFFLPLFLAWCAEIDQTGSYSTIIMGTMCVAAALSPVLSGAIVDTWGLDALLPMVFVTGTLYVAFILALRIPLRRSHASA